MVNFEAFKCFLQKNRRIKSLLGYLFIFIYRNIQYIERDGLEHFHTIKQFPESLSKKITLLKYFRSYMNEHLLKAGADVKPREGDEMTRLPFLKTWFRTRNAMVLQLSNGTLQVSKRNFVGR